MHDCEVLVQAPGAFGYILTIAIERKQGLFFIQWKAYFLINLKQNEKYAELMEVDQDFWTILYSSTFNILSHDVMDNSSFGGPRHCCISCPVIHIRRLVIQMSVTVIA